MIHLYMSLLLKALVSVESGLKDVVRRNYVSPGHR